MTKVGMMTEFKSAILDIWSENVFVHESNIKWFDNLKFILSDYFDVSAADFFVFGTDSFVRLQQNNTYMNQLDVIKWTEIETYFYENNFADVPLIQASGSENGIVSILLRDSNQEPIGLLTMDSTDKWKSFSQTDEVDVFIETTKSLVQTIRQSIYLVQQENQYRNLFNVTKMFHSTLDVGQILEGTLISMRDALPELQITLILSNDQDRKTTVPYKLFDYTSERSATVEAYVSGEITTEEALDLGVCLSNIPIKGKQGIYGIIQIAAPLDYIFSVIQKEFAFLLAAAAGNALENAKLYIQSHRLVSDLQLINETSHKLNTNLSLDEMLAFLRNQLTKSCNPDHTCFVMLENEEYVISSASTELFHTVDGQLYIQYVANHFRKLNDPLFIADFNRLTDLKYEYRSLIAIPLKEQNDITGFSIVLHKDPYFFSFDSFKLMQSLIQHSSLAISNSALRHQLQEMVNRDHLTNLFARKYLDKSVENSMCHDEYGVFILMDIDDFKRVNDTHGHQVGDEILKQIARIIQREADGIGIGARWGGEELALYLPQMSILEGVEVGRQLLKLISLQTNPNVTISVGICGWESTNKDTFHNLFHNADTALYEAKNNGKNQIRVFEESHLK